MSNNMYQCSYVIRKGKFAGNQCLKSGWDGFCNDHTRKLYQRNHRVALLEENNMINNMYMINKCLKTYCYLPTEVVHCDPWVILLWLKSNDQEPFILKHWLISFLINDINNIIKLYYYHLEYDIIFNKLNQ